VYGFPKLSRHLTTEAAVYDGLTSDSGYFLEDESQLIARRFLSKTMFYGVYSGRLSRSMHSWLSPNLRMLLKGLIADWPHQERVLPNEAETLSVTSLLD
jgi:hypothetical protein